MVPPVTGVVSKMLVVPPLHTATSGGSFITGVGFTVTTTVWVGPAQEPICGVITYVTVSTDVPELLRAWAIVLPHAALQDDQPVTLPELAEAVQVKVTGYPAISVFRGTLVDVKLQMVWSGGSTSVGVGYTVALTVPVAEQLFASRTVTV